MKPFIWALAMMGCLVSLEAQAQCINDDDGYVLDWQGRTWSGSGTTPNTFSVERITGGDPVDVVVSFSGNGTSFFEPGYPEVTDFLLAGKPAGTESLLFLVDFPNASRLLTMEIDFPVPVYNVAFEVLDVDGIEPFSGTGGFRDHVRVDGRNTTVSNSRFNPNTSTPYHALPTTTQSPSTVELFSGNTGRSRGLFVNSDLNEDFGNATVSFDQALTEVRLRYNNSGITTSNPNVQGIALHDVVFCIPRFANLEANKTVRVHRSDASGCDQFPGAPEPDLPAAIPGACIEYVIALENTGDGVARAISLTDVLSPHLVFRGAQFAGFDSADPGYAELMPSIGLDCSLSTCEVALTNARLGPGDIGEIFVRVELK